MQSDFEKWLTFPNNTFHTVLCTKDKIPNNRVSLLFPCCSRLENVIMEKRSIPPTKVNRNYDRAGYEFKYKFKATDTGIMIILLTFKFENIIPNCYVSQLFPVHQIQKYYNGNKAGNTNQCKQKLR